MHLLDFEHFDLVRELLKNRHTIVWCTRLQRAQADDERQRIEASAAALRTHSAAVFPAALLAVAGCSSKQVAVATARRSLGNEHEQPCPELQRLMKGCHEVDFLLQTCLCPVQAEMAGSPELAPILEMLNATRASARERQGEIERKIRAEARKLRQGDVAGLVPVQLQPVVPVNGCSEELRAALFAHVASQKSAGSGQ